jgi:hypothetical protein
MAPNRRIHINRAIPFLDQPILESPMIPLDMIMLCVLLHSVAQMPLSQRNDVGQTLGLDRPNESLRIGIQVWTSRWKLHCFDAGGFQGLVNRGSRS